LGKECEIWQDHSYSYTNEEAVVLFLDTQRSYP